VVSQETHPKQFDELDAAKALIASEGVAVCVASAGNKVRAVVLTGSFSRDEATLKREGNGWRVLGDATFLVIHPPAVKLDTAKLGAEIESRLASRSIKCKTVVVSSTPGALRIMKPHIYAFELRERGVVVWGDRSVLGLMPRFTAAEIPIEDGWWFLCNRMIEQLKAAGEEKQPAETEQVQYRIAKLYLSMAACYLLAIGQYKPSYGDRARHLLELANSPSPPGSPICLLRFSKLVSECTALKLQGYTANDLALLPKWDDATSDAEALWRWTLGRILNVGPQHSRSELLRRMRMRQPLVSRLKGWVRAVLKYPTVFSRSSRQWARLICHSSPRYLVYGAASELFFRGSHETERFGSEELAAIAKDLPLSKFRVHGQPTWRGMAALIADNYHAFVESTRT